MTTHKEILIKKAKEDLGSAYAVEIRYDEFVEITKEEVAKIVFQTEKALKFVAGKLN